MTAALAASGYAVRVFDRVAPADPAVPFVPGDVQDPVAVARALEGVDAVCHHAATVGMGLDLSDLPRYAATNASHSVGSMPSPVQVPDRRKKSR